ncbi:MAG: LytTR family transcriptional regulator DNA-binding domain-containing protein [Lachnospira sp.]|nr:LytTR family transcriptional regulator DNA-binding domain-containing protein [Lachnospira sp.]
MIHMLAYNPQKQELEDICDITKYQAAMLTDDRWNIRKFLLMTECRKFVEQNPNLDVICFDITQPGGIAQIEKIRKKYTGAYVILLSDITISPVRYMKPTIMAASLLLRPFQKDDVVQVVREMMRTFSTEDNTGKVFIVEDENGKNRIPYRDILFFESREKKIYVCTQNMQLGFYDTIERLCTQLPPDFKRCHRSYIVNTSYIQKIVFTENMIYLSEGSMLPVSRSYRTEMKEFKYGK